MCVCARVCVCVCVCVRAQGVDFTLDEECVRKSSKGTLGPEDISGELERLLQEKADNQRIFDWVEVRMRVCVCVCVCVL